MKEAFLEIRTWTDSYTVWYAEHFYGCIKFDKRRVDIYGKISAAEAAKLNKEDQDAGYVKGDRSSRFFSREKLIRAAIDEFKKDPHGYDILLVGEHAVCDPLEMIVGPDNIMTKANFLWRRFEEYDGWNASEKHWPELEKISEEWEKTIGRV